MADIDSSFSNTDTGLDPVAQVAAVLPLKKKGSEASEPFLTSKLVAAQNYFLATGFAAFFAGALEAAGAAAAGAAFKAAR